MNQTETKTNVIAKTMIPFIALANTLVNRFNGFKSIEEVQGPKLGMRFATISFRKPMKMRKFHRTEKNDMGKKLPNPFFGNVFEIGKISIDLNAIWENCVNNKADRQGENGSIGFEANKKRSNGIENYDGSRVVCHKIKDAIETFYLNYVVANYIGETKYVDGDNNPLDYADLAEYHQTKSYASKKHEADKHGLEVENDVQIRQMKFENITELAIFGVRYVPTESATEVVDVETPKMDITKVGTPYIELLPKVGQNR
jgi:hypothetical protein